MEGEFFEKISSSGTIGIKRIDLKKMFGKKCENVLKNLIEKNEVIVEKKGAVYFVWTKKNHALHLSQTSHKSKLASSNTENVNSLNVETKSHPDGLPNVVIRSTPINPNIDFKIEFDRCLTESPTSIGWTPFLQIRKKLCISKNISSDYFYTLASELVEKHRENYEISSGGQEGIMMRGLVHGFVRNI